MIDAPEVLYRGTATDDVAIQTPRPSRRVGERIGFAPGILAKGPEGPGPAKTAAFVRGFKQAAGLPFNKANFVKIRPQGAVESLFVNRATGQAGVMRGGAPTAGGKDPMLRQHVSGLVGNMSHAERLAVNVHRGAVRGGMLRQLGARAADFAGTTVGQAVTPLVAGRVADTVLPRDRHGRRFTETALGATATGFAPAAMGLAGRRLVGPRIG